MTLLETEHLAYSLLLWAEWKLKRVGASLWKGFGAGVGQSPGRKPGRGAAWGVCLGGSTLLYNEALL